MSNVSRNMVATGLMLITSAVVFAQGYYPGQSFSAGQTPAPARQTPTTMYGQQPVMIPGPAHAPQVQYPSAPVQQRRQPAATPGAMYNIERPARAASSPAPSATKPPSSSNASKPAETKPASSSASSSSSESKPAVSESTPKSEPKTESATATPVVPDSTDKLVFMNRRTGKKLVALTYDDGPNPGLTPKLAKWLKDNNVPATFFFLGQNVKQYPQLAKEVADMGFEMANHSYTHPDLRKRSDEQILNELQDTHDIIKEVTGIDCHLMRPPYGAHNSKVDDVCRRLGYKIINWDVDTNDWRGRSADAMVQTIMSQTGDGSIILMHDRKHRGRESVLETTQKAVEQLRAKGYTFVTVGELLDMTPATIATVRPGESVPAPAPAVAAVAEEPVSTAAEQTTAPAVDSGTIFP